MPRKKMKKGMVQVYTGVGKGKTTAALGLGLRAIGQNYKVLMVQFMKGRKYGELKAIEKYLPGFVFVQFGRDEFVDKKSPSRVDILLAKKGLRYAKDEINKGEYDMVILDEVNIALDYDMISKEDVLNIIKNKPPHVEVVLTGRYAPHEIIAAADYVTETKEVKHPYKKGVSGRAGIEF